MTECTRFAPMIGARPGELSDQETQAMAEHLATCEGCQARLADEQALSGMLSEALMAEANRRDFSSFSGEVLARIPEYAAVRPSTPLRSAQGEREVAAASVRPERSAAGAESKGERERGILSRLGTWARRHRAAAIASMLAPAAVAAALVIYFDASSPEQQAALEVTAEGRGTMVLQTNEGPVVLIGDESDGT